MNKIKKNDGVGWVYSEEVKDHFLNPRNIVKTDVPDWKYNGEGEVGSPACGDVMKVWILVEKNKIKKIGWKTFGCASAIASTSIMSEMVLGKEILEAKQITAKKIIDQLGGLPRQKIHCSVLGDQALKKAIDDFESKLER
ncbi:MAG: iron-sulfur cluster assembly scaffold protein [Patescibacteria group bacterium]